MFIKDGDNEYPQNEMYFFTIRIKHLLVEW